MRAAIKTEWLLLWRDRVGLLIQIILPMVLVIFLTVTQGKTMNHISQVRLVLNDQDQTALSTKIMSVLYELPHYKIVSPNQSHEATLTIPEGYTASLIKTLQEAYSDGHSVVPAKQMHLQFTPGTPTAVKSLVELPINLINQELQQTVLLGIASSSYQPPQINIHWLKAQTARHYQQPNAVQTYVTGWAIFGMFFIVIPLAGNMVRERQMGVVQRLRVAPRGASYFLLSKLVPYFGFNILQFVLIMLLGIYVIPLFGMPVLDFYAVWPQMLLVAGLTSLMAISYALFVGSIANTPQQASVAGPFFNVMLAAIGGIFVPTALMPDTLQTISQYSPMRWAHQSFVDMLLHHNLASISHYCGYMLAFAVVMFLLASLAYRR